MYKRLISFLCVFLLFFNIFTYKPKADALGGALMGGILLEGSSLAGAGSAIIASAPYVAAFAVVCIGLGVVYQNREQIQASLVSAYNYAKSQGKNLLDYFSTSSDGRVAVNSEGLGLITGAIKEYKLDSSSIDTIGHIGTYSFNGGTISVPTGVKVSFPLTGTDNLILKVTGSPIAGYLQPQSEIKIDGKNIHFINDVFSSKIFWLGLSYSSTGWKYWTSWISESDLRNKIVNLPSGTYSGSICADFSIDITQKYNGTGSISVDRLLGDNIGVLDDVASVPIFQNPSISLDKDVSISIPTDVTWDYVIDRTYDDTLDITNEATSDTDIPNTGDGTGGLDMPTSSLDLSPLYIDLSKKFPFSIPWDVYNLINSFNVPKERPVYTFNLDLKDLGTYSFDLDFAFFDNYLPLSSMFRYFLLVSFVYALIVNTRKFIGG